MGWFRAAGIVAGLGTWGLAGGAALANHGITAVSGASYWWNGLYVLLTVPVLLLLAAFSWLLLTVLRAGPRPWEREGGQGQRSASPNGRPHETPGALLPSPSPDSSWASRLRSILRRQGHRG